MPRYDFQCNQCGHVEEMDRISANPVLCSGPCLDLPADMAPGTMRRVWSAPSIGRGTSGGTPAR